MNAFVCATPVHILRAIHMHSAIPEYAGETDIYICDTFAGAARIAENLRGTGCFRRVSFVKYPVIRKLLALQVLFRIPSGFFWKKKEHSYERIVGFNIDNGVTDALYWLAGADVSYDCVEDAPGIYPFYVPKQYEWYKGRMLIGLEKAYFHMKKWWFSQPDLVHPEAGMEEKKVRLPELVNRVFEYVPDEMLYHADLLIMEESMYTDHIMTGNADYVLYKAVRERYPDQNIVVKLHPRTKDNRFADEFQVMKSTGIPWEVYLLNQIHQGYKIPPMMGIACVTMSSDKFLLDMESVKLVLLPMFYDRIKKRENGEMMFGENIEAQFVNLRKSYRQPEKILILKNREELFRILDLYFN